LVDFSCFYLFLIASTAGILAAIRAGHTPKNAPNTVEKISIPMIKTGEKLT
jgi:hypothetical protein